MNYKKHIPKFPFPFLLSAVSSLKVQIFYSLQSSSIRFVLSRENEVESGKWRPARIRSARVPGQGGAVSTPPAESPTTCPSAPVSRATRATPTPPATPSLPPQVRWRVLVQNALYCSFSSATNCGCGSLQSLPVWRACSVQTPGTGGLLSVYPSLLRRPLRVLQPRVLDWQRLPLNKSLPQPALCWPLQRPLWIKCRVSSLPPQPFLFLPGRLRWRSFHCL